MKYREECVGLEDHIDISGVFEIGKFEIVELACK